MPKLDFKAPCPIQDLPSAIRPRYVGVDEVRQTRLTHLQAIVSWQNMMPGVECFPIPFGRYPHSAKGFSEIPENNISNEASNTARRYEGFQMVYSRNSM